MQWVNETIGWWDSGTVSSGTIKHGDSVTVRQYGKDVGISEPMR